VHNVYSSKAKLLCTLVHVISAILEGTSSSNGKADGVISRSAFTRILDDLLESRSQDRAEMIRLHGQRKDQILAGALLVNELFRQLDLKEIHLCRSALREGILLDHPLSSFAGTADSQRSARYTPTERAQPGAAV
jgi:exopolyphosphatase/pppGpp-phosphohydrolase